MKKNTMGSLSLALFLQFFYTHCMEKNLYFDCAATALFDEALLKDAFEKTLSLTANPSSLHAKGHEAKLILEKQREKAAISLGIPKQYLYFTSGGTEANQIALLSLLTRPNKGKVLISAIEHAAISEQAKMLTHCGWTVDTIPVDTDGFIKLEVLKEKLTSDTALVSVMAVNNETGAIQPIQEIGALLKSIYENKAKPRFHVDAVQAIGKIPFLLAEDGIDSAALSAHKIGGPRGIGALYSKKQIDSFLKGGGQENGIRSGTENLFAIYGFAEALEKYSLINNSLAYERFETQKTLMRFFLEEIQNIDGAHIIPKTRKGNCDEKFSPWIVQIAFRNIPAQVLIRALSAKGISISSGSACSSKKLSRHVLEAMNLSKALIQNAVRFSFCPSHTKADMQQLLITIKEVIEIFS